MVNELDVGTAKADLLKWKTLLIDSGKKLGVIYEEINEVLKSLENQK